MGGDARGFLTPSTKLHHPLFLVAVDADDVDRCLGFTSEEAPTGGDRRGGARAGRE